MKSKRNIVTFVVGTVLLLVGFSGVSLAWIKIRIADEAREMTSVLHEILEAKDDPIEIARMAGSPPYNRLAVTWIMQAAFSSQLGDVEVLRNTVLSGVSRTNDFELYKFMMAADKHVVDLSPEHKEAYAQAGALASFIKLDLPEDFLNAWNVCHRQLVDRYESYFSNWLLAFDLAFPDNEQTCPTLNRTAEKTASI